MDHRVDEQNTSASLWNHGPWGGCMGAAASDAGDDADKAAGTFYCVLTYGALECKTLASQGNQIF